ncbi:hypothetical protein BgiMline_026034 [Biomphalaria glabrata]|nr:hypothetical protein BgiMline_031243 [Biomphalaria glabrata]KAI8778563.1 hypothetical protein BgiBS90_021213 [Biomphalaria glabrata]
MFKVGALKDMLFLTSLLSLTLNAKAEFNVREYCSQRCLRGQGGILCKCNAVHFNGKRSQPLHSPRHTGNFILETQERPDYRSHGDLPSTSWLDESDMDEQSWQDYPKLLRIGQDFSHSVRPTNTLPFVLIDQQDKSISRQESEQLVWPESSSDLVSPELDNSEMNDSQSHVRRLRKALLQALQGR